MSICLTAADDYLDHLVKLMYLVSLRFFIINLLHFSLIYCIVDKYLGYEFEQALGYGEGQASLACCPWGSEESDMTESD